MHKTIELKTLTAEIITHTRPSELIRNLRESGNQSILDLARDSGYSYQTIYTLEGKRGIGARPCGGHWRTICDLLDAMGYDIIIRRRENA